MKRKVYAHYFNPVWSVRRSTELKHWFGKRVKIGHTYAKIVEARLDRDMNFINWVVRFGANRNWKVMPLKDPNYNYDVMHLVRDKNSLTGH